MRKTLARRIEPVDFLPPLQTSHVLDFHHGLLDSIEQFLGPEGGSAFKRLLAAYLTISVRCSLNFLFLVIPFSVGGSGPLKAGHC